MSTQTSFGVSPDPDPSPSGHTLLIPSFPSIQQLSSYSIRLEWDSPLWQRTALHALWWMLFPQPAFCSHQISHFIYLPKPILQRPSQIPTPRTMTWIWFPREKLLSSLNSCSSLKHPTSIQNYLCSFFLSPAPCYKLYGLFIFFFFSVFQRIHSSFIFIQHIGDLGRFITWPTRKIKDSIKYQYLLGTVLGTKMWFSRKS